MSGPAAHPDVTWPLSTPSSSGPARCARETLVVGRYQRPTQNGGCGSDSGENGSENAQAEPSAVQLLR
ncbi:hypothetical protein TYRP_020737 [Tyrophagus putrescentiae]|nr:hypothetical protein TYRP_020737 [Tyrophagus putrescentiae]